MKKILISFLALFILCGYTSEAAEKWGTYRIMIDPGHGGTDPGASGPTKPHEAELALACGLKLKDFVVNQLGGTIKLTRETDTYITLTARKSASVSYDPYIFCSIHLNAFNGTASGTETWYYHSTGNSKVLATRVHATLISEMNRTNRGVKQNGWTVITGSASVPAILTEGMFVDNKTEHDLIKDKSGTGFLNWVRGHLYGFYTHLKAVSGKDLINPRNVAAISGSGGTVVTTPTLDVSPTTLSGEVTYEAGVTDTYTFDVTGENLTAAISISSNNSNFALSSTSISKANANKTNTITVTWTPSGIGSETATITVKCGDLSKTVKITGTAVAPPLKLESKWIFSEYNGKYNSKGWDATKVRNIAYYKGKLYMVYNQKEIKVINAQTGEDLGSLSNTGVSGGVITLCDVRVFKGKVYACNIGKPAVKDADGNVTTAAVPLKIYRWDSDTSDPVCVLKTSSMSTAARLGDCMTFRGTEADGDVVFANDNGTNTRIVHYKITNGVFATSPSMTKNAKNAEGAALRAGASARIYATTDSTYWLTGQHVYTTLLTKAGKQSYFINGDETWGNEFARIKYNSSSFNYAFETTYSEIDGINYLKGQMRVLQKGSTWKESKVVQTIPAAGLSNNNSNTSCASSIATSTTTSGDNTIVEVWMSINGQGVMYYISKGDTPPTYDVQPITPPAPVDPVITASSSVTVPETMIGETGSVSFTVKGTDLVNDITLALTDAANVFTLSDTKIAKGTGSASKKITVSYTPKAAGSNTATIKLSTKKEDGTAVTATVNVKATAIPKIDINTDIVLKNEWNYSENAGNLSSADWFSSAGQITRSVAATATNVYVLNASSNGFSPVTVLDANTGQVTGTMDMTGISGGLIEAAHLETLGTDLLLSNVASTTAHTLTVYRWSNCTGKPSVLISDATHGGIQVGDILSTSGDMTAGKIYVSDGSTVLVYTVTNGTATQTPAKITLTKNGAAYSVGSMRGIVKVIPLNDGTFYVIGKDKHPTLFNEDGTYISELSTSHINGAVHGTGGAIFNFGNKRFGAFSTYDTGSTTLAGGKLALVDMTDTDNPTHMSLNPESGLGTTRNTDFITSVSHVLTKHNSNLELYLAVPKQGVAKFSWNGDNATNGVDAITETEPAVTLNGNILSVEGAEVQMISVYNVAGQTVATGSSATLDINPLPAGVYLVKAKLTDGIVITSKIVK